jgi:hypothetical protein
MSGLNQKRFRRLFANTALVFASAATALILANIILWIFNIGKVEIYRYDPDYGYLAVPDQWPSPRGITFRINDAGLRGPDFSPVKKPGTLRLAFVGDSVTFGGGIVSDADTFVSLAAARLSSMSGRNIDTINISAPGWSVQNIKGYVARYGLHDADALIWILPREDFYRPFSHEGMPTESGFRLQFLLSVSMRRLIALIRPKIRSNPPESTSAQDAASSATLAKNIAAFKYVLAYARSRRIRIFVIFVPEGDLPADSLPQAYAEYRITAESFGAKICDISGQIDADGGWALFYDGVHLNPRGHQVTAALVAQCVSNSLSSLVRTAN